MSMRRITLILAVSLCAATGLATTPLMASAATHAPTSGARVASAGPAGTLSTTHFDFPAMYAEDDSAPQTVTLTSTGTDPLVISGPVVFYPDDYDLPDAMRITASTCDGATLDPGDQCTVTIVAHPESIGTPGGWIYFTNNSSTPLLQVTMYVHSIDPTTGQFFPVGGHRVLDTRSGVGAAQHPVGASSTLHLQVLGQGGLPPSGVSAVVLNLTVTHPSTSGFVTVFPSGTGRPGVSSINFTRGWTGANLVTVPVGSNGKVDLYNSSGSTDLIADVDGWYASTKSVDPSYGAGVGYWPSGPKRVLDTRDINGAHQPLGAGQDLNVQLPVPFDFSSASVRAAAITLTAVAAPGTGYLSAGAVDADLTKTSTLNLRPGVTTSNLAVVSAGPCTAALCPGAVADDTAVIKVHNGSAHPVDLLVDLQGLYADPEGAPYRFHAITPTRVVDSRSHLGTTPLGPAATRLVSVHVPGTTDQTAALVANVTAVRPTRNTVITIFSPGGVTTHAKASILNPIAGSVVATGAVIRVSPSTGTGSAFTIYNSAGTTNVLVDVSGRFDFFLPDDPLI